MVQIRSPAARLRGVSSGIRSECVARIKISVTDTVRELQAMKVARLALGRWHLAVALAPRPMPRSNPLRQWWGRRSHGNRRRGPRLRLQGPPVPYAPLPPPPGPAAASVVAAGSGDPCPPLPSNPTWTWAMYQTSVSCSPAEVNPKLKLIVRVEATVYREWAWSRLGGALGKHSNRPGTRKKTMSTQAKTLRNMAAAG